MGWQQRCQPIRAYIWVVTACSCRSAPTHSPLMMPTSRSLALVALLAAVPAGAQQGTSPRAFQLADWYKLTTLSGPAMSPSGDRVAFTVTTVREAENKRHNEIWVVPTAGGEPQR